MNRSPHPGTGVEGDERASPGAVRPGKFDAALIGYLHTSFEAGSAHIRMDDVPDAWDVINLSFAEPTSRVSGDIRLPLWRPGHDPAALELDLIDGISRKRAAGKTVLLSIGGDAEVVLDTKPAAAEFVRSVKRLIDRFGVDGIDVNFEGSSLWLDSGDHDYTRPRTGVVINLIAALRTLKDTYGDGLVMTMSPETFFVHVGHQTYGPDSRTDGDARAGVYLPVIHALRAELTALQVQLYNTGAVVGLDGRPHPEGSARFLSAMADMLIAGFEVAGRAGDTFPGLAPHQVAMGLPAVPELGRGYVAPATVQRAYDAVLEHRECDGYAPRTCGPSRLAGLMAWSINWDSTHGHIFSRSHAHFLAGSSL